MRIYHTLFFISAIALLLTVNFSCKTKEPITTHECTNSVALTYNDDILPVLQMTCMTGQCHARFDEYTYVKKFADNDKLLGSVQHKEGYSPMPKGDEQLPDSLIVLLSCWVQNGALEK